MKLYQLHLRTWCVKGPAAVFKSVKVGDQFHLITFNLCSIVMFKIIWENDLWTLRYHTTPIPHPTKCRQFILTFMQFYKTYIKFSPWVIFFMSSNQFLWTLLPKLPLFRQCKKKKRHINHRWSVTQSTEGLGVTRWAGLQRWEVKSRSDRQMEESGQDLKDEEGDERWSWLGAVTVWDMDDPPHQCDRGL